MLYLIENASALKSGVWNAKLEGQYLDQLPSGGDVLRTPFSIVAAPIIVRGKDLMFNPEDARVLGRNNSDDVLIIDLRKQPEHSDRPESRSTKPWLRDRDEGFYEACRQLVGNDFADLGRELVNGFRKLHPGRLVEGKSRKWLNQPDNFVALTIQNRDRSFAVSIRSIQEAEASRLSPKPDRPGYLRFKVSAKSDLPEALRLILASARRA